MISVALSYAAPSFEQSPALFPSIPAYNPFPDLNDLAADGSRSLFPVRAKYHLPTDSTLFPSAVSLLPRDLPPKIVTELGPHLRQRIEAIRRHHPDAIVNVPRSPASAREFLYTVNFELAHKRLAATPRKWALRTFLISSFYTSLEDWIAADNPIPVPLRPDPDGSELERHWSDIVHEFLPTRMLDEAVSLLLGVTIYDEAHNSREQEWVEQQDEEIPGFAKLYKKMRRLFKPKSCRSARERLALADRIIQQAETASSLGVPTVQREALQRSLANREGNNGQRISWPDMVPAGLQTGPRQLRVGLIAPSPVGGVSAAVSGMLSVDSFNRNWQGRIDNLFEDYANFIVPSVKQLARPTRSPQELLDPMAFGPGFEQLIAAPSSLLRDVVRRGVTFLDGAAIDERTAGSLAVYFLFIESLRQQVCTGVGLRCPFWRGRHCCEFQGVLRHVYQLAEPWLWEDRWIKPPCFDRVTPASLVFELLLNDADLDVQATS